MLVGNVTESTEPIVVSCLSKTSVESDVDKQVNFVIVPLSECILVTLLRADCLQKHTTRETILR